MKHILKLLKDWSDAEGNEFKAGDQIEVEDAQLAKDLIFDGTAEKVEQKKSDEGADILTVIKTAVSEAVAGAVKAIKPEKKEVHIETHDKSDDDPSLGYLPERVGDKWTDEEKSWGFGNFCLDVYRASKQGSSLPSGLKTMQERWEKMVEKASKQGFINKASGDVQQVDVDSDGGFLVPPEFSMMLLDQQAEISTIRPRCSSMTIGSDRIELPQAMNYDHSSNLIYGGLQAYWKGEEDQLTESKVTFEDIGLTLNALTALAKASHKMMKFSPQSVASWLVPKLSEAIVWKEEDAFVAGTGAGMPLGLINAPSKVEVAIESGQTLAATALVTNNILKMYQQARVERPGSLVWLYNRVDAFFWLSTLTVDVGTGGSHVGLMTRMPNSPEMNLLGLPLLDNEHCKALGTAGDIILSDLSQYIIADHRSGPEVAQSMHLNFDYGKECFRIMKYVDGQPRYSSTFTRQNATNSSASVITLAARS